MNLSYITLPSNRRFGFFFAAIFLASGIYLFLNQKILAAYVIEVIGFLFLAVTLLKSDLLLPLNKLWMRFGLVLGMIVSPIVLGVIFFGLFTPISFVMRLAKRDELRLHFKKKASYWVLRINSTAQPNTFKLQF